jgi:hypothetical protein
MLHWARYTIGYSFDVALSREDRILLCVSFPGGGGTAVRAHAKKIKLADVTKL